MIPDIWQDVVDFFTHNIYHGSKNQQADIKACLSGIEIQTFHAVEIPIPD